MTAVTVAVGLLLAGCAGPPPRSGAPDPTPGAGAVPTTVAPVQPGQVAVGPAQIDASAIPGGYPGPTTVDRTGNILTLTATEGGCITARAELGVQDATSVAVRLVTTRSSDGVCSALAVLVPVTVALAAPLGTRTVVLSQQRR